ncbi:hypothetical protein Tco_1533961 [Tanacetum coccineum]
MADVNAPIEQAPAVAPPIRTDEQILPRIRLVPIGKSNCYLNAEKLLGLKGQDSRWFIFLMGIINQAHIDMRKGLEEFTQSIHTFMEDKKNLAQHTQGKKKATLIVIPSVRFTKLIIFHLQRKHKFHPRPESPLHLPTEEPIMGYLKFSAKGTKREVFGMPIPNELITDDIRGANYYDAYLEKVAKHQRYLVGKEVSDPDSPAPKLAKSTKPKVTKEAKPVAPKAVTKKPQPAPTKPKEKKRKHAKETTKAAPPAKRAKAGKGIPLTEPGFGDLEADTQRAIEESLKDAHGAPRGPLPPVVFRETDTGKFQPLPEVEGKGKEKIGAEQAAQEMPPVVKSGDQDEGQAGPDPAIQDKGQAEPNSDDVAESQPLSTPGVHAGPNLEHTNDEATDATSQPQPGQMDEEFTITAYPNVQENLKLTVDEPVIPESLPALQGLSLEERLDKHGSRLYRLENQDIPNQVSKAVDEIVTDAVDWAMHAPLRERFRDLPEADMKEILHNRMWESKSYQTHEDHMTLYEALEKSMARDNRDQLLSDLAEARKKKKKRQGSPKTPPGSPPHPPPPPPPPAGPSGTSGASGASGSSQSQPPPPPPSNNQGGQSTSTAAPSSSKTAASAEYTAWTMTDTRLKPSASPIPEELHMDDDPTADEQAYSSSGEDVGRDHIPTVNLRQSWWKPITEDRPATPEPAWSIPSSDLTVPTNNWASALKSTYTPPPENSLLAQIGDMATFMDCASPVLNGRMPQTSLRSGGRCNPKVQRQQITTVGWPTLSISKMKAAYYPDVGLEKMVPDQMWIEEECKYDIVAIYGISHWWFQIQRFYIDRHTSEGDHRAVRTHMRILSVVRFEVFPMYGYNYMKKIVLRRADLKEYVISERDFKYMYPSDFKDLYLLNLQGHLKHLSPEDKKILTTAVNLWTRNLVIRQRVEDFQLRIESYQTQLNLTKPRCDAKGFEYKHDFTVIDSPRAVTFRDKYGVQMITRFNEIHKFSDGILHQIDEALD